MYDTETMLFFIFRDLVILASHLNICLIYCFIVDKYMIIQMYSNISCIL